MLASPPSGWTETLHVAVYDFGVFSCRRILSWPPEMAWPELVSVGAELIHRTDMRSWAEPLALAR